MVINPESNQVTNINSQIPVENFTLHLESFISGSGGNIDNLNDIK